MTHLQQQLSEQELLSNHAEVLALQHRLGLSYKDASHRLYMAEVEKLKVAQASEKAFRSLDRRLEQYLTNIAKRFRQGEVDADVQMGAEEPIGTDAQIAAYVEMGTDMDTT